MRVSWWKIAIPVILGLGAAAWLIASEIDAEMLSGIDLSLKMVCYILLAFVFMVGRDLGYMIRIRLFSSGQLSWKQAFRVIMLWEFTSAITPSTVGGTAVAVVYVHKEGLSVGKSAAMVMLTAFFDEFFFALCFPLAVVIVGWDTLFSFPGAGAIVPLVIAGYFVKLILAVLLSYGLFFNAKGLGGVLIKIFSWRPLRRWQESVKKTANDIVLSSKEIKNYRPAFWIKAFLATSLSWCSRFLVANAIFMAFIVVSDQLLVFARQLVMWVPMIISPTPGGAGFAEYIFSNFLGDIVTTQEGAGMTALIALLWRAVTFYPYLIIGALIIPRWLASFSKGNRSSSHRSQSNEL